MLTSFVVTKMPTQVDKERLPRSTSRGWPSLACTRTSSSSRPWLIFFTTTSSYCLFTVLTSPGSRVVETGLAPGFPARRALCSLVKYCIKLFNNYFVIKATTNVNTTLPDTSRVWCPTGGPRPCPSSRLMGASLWLRSWGCHLKTLTVSLRLYTLILMFKILSLMEF